MFTDFKGNWIRELILGNSRELLWNFTPRNSWEILLITYPKIPEKFLVLGHQVYRFLGELNKRINFEKFQGISPWISPQEIPEKFLGLGYQVYGFLGELNKRISFEKFLRIFLEFFSRNSWELLRIPENFSGIFLQKFMRNFQDFFT